MKLLAKLKSYLPLKSETKKSIIRMQDSWDYDLIEILKQARLGKSRELDDFLKNYSSFAATNVERTLLLLMRHFHANYWQGEKKVMNCHPEGENFQLGITIVTSNEDGGSQSNIYLPNDRSYLGLEIHGKQINIITDIKTIKTNSGELFQKMEFWEGLNDQDIEKKFDSLNNEKFEVTKNVKRVTDIDVKLPTIGGLTYNEKYNWYEGKFTNENYSFEINIQDASDKDLRKLFSYADEWIKSKNYEIMLLKMENQMLKLKNETWLNEEENEQKIEVEEFHERISIESIVFNDDFSTTIYCEDDDLFFGHSIVINIDETGKYNGANLVG